MTAGSTETNSGTATTADVRALDCTYLGGHPGGVPVATEGRLVVTAAGLAFEVPELEPALRVNWSRLIDLPERAVSSATLFGTGRPRANLHMRAAFRRWRWIFTTLSALISFVEPVLSLPASDDEVTTLQISLDLDGHRHTASFAVPAVAATLWMRSLPRRFQSRFAFSASPLD